MSADFSRVAIVGCGLIGGSIELALRDHHPLTDVVTLDRNDGLEPVRGADLVILSAPIRPIIDILPRLRSCVSPATLVTDTAEQLQRTFESAAR